MNLENYCKSHGISIDEDGFIRGFGGVFLMQHENMHTYFIAPTNYEGGQCSCCFADLFDRKKDHVIGHFTIDDAERLGMIKK